MTKPRIIPPYAPRSRRLSPDFLRFFCWALTLVLLWFIAWSYANKDAILERHNAPTKDDQATMERVVRVANAEDRAEKRLMRLYAPEFIAKTIPRKEALRKKGDPKNPSWWFGDGCGKACQEEYASSESPKGKR